MSIFADTDEDGSNDLNPTNDPTVSADDISSDRNAPTTQVGQVSITLDRDVQLVSSDLDASNIQPNDALSLNGTPLTISSDANVAQRVQALADAINGLGSGVSASVVGETGLQLSSASGDPIKLTYQGSGSLSLSGGTNVSSDGTNPTLVDSIFNGVTPTAFTSNTFDPTDQGTYNHATSSTIYDSLGNPHVMTQYFVKEPNTSASQGNAWTMYVQVDGENVGDPPNSSGEPTMAQYDLVFDEEGNLQSIDGDPDGEVLISNWTPVDGNGQPNGADGPRLVSSGGTTPIPDPPVSSNFVIDLGDTTQFGSEFAVNDQSQNGYTTGRLSGLDVSDAGVIFARYSNGQSQSLGQVSLATFKNAEGLSPVGDTTWVETFESGQPIIGSPGSGTLGSIAASSVEESNVDLSEELVNLIIAQRNYQANAKTIETSDAVTQTIINLR
ncbi:flagellar hook-basal body complex protein [Marinobacter sp. NFXS9]